MRIIQYERCPYKEEKFDIRRENSVNMKSASQGEGQGEDSRLTAFRRHSLANTFIFGFLVSRTVRQKLFVLEAQFVLLF